MLGLRFALALALSGIAAGGCGVPDRFENQYYVTILNDTSRGVIVLQCDDDDCNGDFHHHESLDPGESYRVSVSTRGVPNPWLVTTMSERRVGCLPLVMPKPVKGLVARISESVPCRTSYDEDKQWPPPARRP